MWITDGTPLLWGWEVGWLDEHGGTWNFARTRWTTRWTIECHTPYTTTNKGRNILISFPSDEAREAAWQRLLVDPIPFIAEVIL